MKLRGRDVVSITDLSREELDELFRTARLMEERPSDYYGSLKGRILAVLFFEPSTRTRLSFEAAMKRLGGDVVGFSSVEGTSLMKGESFEDTVRTVEGYCDAMVIRHPAEGAAARAAELVEVPVINGGDGAREHPTQAMVDLYTIWRLRGSIDGVKVALLADLQHARTVNSLVLALSMYRDVKLLLATPGLRLRSEVYEEAVKRGVKVEEVGLKEAVKEAEVLYVTRVQRERLKSEEEYLRLKDAYRL
ncbi:MAG: aspartate carbamoyltransferase, partial [Thermoprotei archaeon]